MDDRAGEKTSSINLIVDNVTPNVLDMAPDAEKDLDENKTGLRKYRNKHMKLFPELYRSDVSINPSYTGLKNLPYYVVCRRRALKKKQQISRQLNREIMHFAMMQSHALASAKIDRIFSIGFPPEATHVPDFAAMKERRRINQLIYER